MLNCVNNIHITDKLKDGMNVNYTKQNIKTLIKIPDVSHSFFKIHSLDPFLHLKALQKYKNVTSLSFFK